jgi:hypothetical protein
MNSVNGITQTTIANTNYYSNTTASNTTAEPTKTEVAATVEISAAGRQNLELKIRGPEDFHFANMDEVLAQQRELKEKGMQDPKRLDPFDDPFQLRGVTYQFPDGSLEKSLTDYLEGKAINPSLVAAELSRMLKSTYSNPGATIEERAVTRETAVRNAEYIAQNYFRDHDEAQGFMALVRKAAEKDILREKGYFAFDNSDKIIKAHSLPGSENAFNANAKRVAEIIAVAVERISETAVNDSLQRLLKAFLEVPPY